MTILEFGGQIWPKERQYGSTVTCPSIISDQGMLQQEGKCILSICNLAWGGAVAAGGKCNLSFCNQGGVVAGGEM